MRQALEQVLEARFGAIPEETRQIIATADLEALQGWIGPAAVASSLDELRIVDKDS